MPKISRQSRSIAKKITNERPATITLRPAPSLPARGNRVVGVGLNKTKTYNPPAIKKKCKKLK